MADVPIGYRRTLEAINAGEDLASFLNVLLSNLPHNNRLLGDALSCLVDCHENARKAGHLATPSEDPDIRQLLAKSGTAIAFELTLALSSEDTQRTGKMISGLVVSINELRQTMQWPDTRATDRNTPEVIDVRVIEMPTRTSTVSVERNKAGAVVGSTHVEVDA